MEKIIPRDISAKEPCVRCIMHPMMYSESKKQLRREALLPASNKTDVSLLRLDYTTLDFCINHGKKINNENFRGIASICLQNVLDINNKEEHIKNKIQSNIIYGPMHQGEYVLDKVVYMNDKNVELPMHADLRYNQSFEEGEVKTIMRKYASSLVDKMKIVHILK